MTRSTTVAIVSILAGFCLIFLENQQFFWKFRGRIADLVLKGYEMHNVHQDVSTIAAEPGELADRDKQ
jgi:hypothetical protein